MHITSNNVALAAQINSRKQQGLRATSPSQSWQPFNEFHLIDCIFLATNRSVRACISCFQLADHVTRALKRGTAPRSKRLPKMCLLGIDFIEEELPIVANLCPQ